MNVNVNEVKLGSLIFGDCFISDGQVYIKTDQEDGEHDSVCILLTLGVASVFSKETIVRRICGTFVEE